MVSILVPVYNVSSFIEKCVSSLMEQTYDDLEFIFVDDASQDNSIELLKRILLKYPLRRSNVHIINSDSNKGLATTRNIAIKAASGKYILHVDSDDWLEPDAVELLIAKAEKENADLVVSDFTEIHKNKSIVIHNGDTSTPHNYAKSLLRRKSLTYIIGKLIRRNTIIDNNLWAIDGINQGEDYLLIPKIAYFSNKVAKIDKPIYNYNRLNTSSYTANVNDNAINTIIKVQDLLLDFFSSIPEAKDFEETLKESCIYNKLTCLYSGPFTSYKRIAALYKDIHWRNMNLKPTQRFLLTLIDLKLLHLAHWFVSAGKRFRS